ncbi:hypothetical protein AB0I68_36020 [Streptomyces sp. NPDC050448]|uniref:hypothetical protein n=1 Tax=Streptomyces sp. NPDC050448 TaxID=3155404 RepID=UPI00344583A4
MAYKAYEEHGTGGTGDPTAVPAAVGLFLLAVGGWLLNIARPWRKPGPPITLGLGWAVALALLLWGLVLLTRCVRTVHGVRQAPYGGGPSGNEEADRGGEDPARPAT